MTVCVVLIEIPMCWGVSAVLPIISITVPFHRLSNNACILVGKSLPLPFLITYFLFNCTIFLMIIGLYIPIIKTLNNSATMTKSRRTSLIPIILQLGAVVLTNFLCWMTMCIMAVVSLTGAPLVSSVESLVSLVIFPLNSIINPTINIFRTKQFLSSFMKIVMKKSYYEKDRN